MKLVQSCLLPFTLLAATTACSPGDPSANVDDAASGDVAVTPPAPTCPDRLPMGATPYGRMPGQQHPNLTLANIDEGAGDFHFYDESSFCQAEVTVTILAALWCGNCQAEAGQLERQINQNPDYRDANGNPRVRVVTIVIENTLHEPATLENVRFWRDRYQLTSPVVGDLTMAARRAIFLPGTNGLPVNVVSDAHGVITQRLNGYDQGLAALHTAIRAALGMPPQGG
jgi:hypothetical protein